MRYDVAFVFLLLALACGGCDEAASGGGGGDSDTDTDGDTDTDSDSDTDADSDSDTDTGPELACPCEADVGATAYDEQGGFCGPVVSLLAQSFVPSGNLIDDVELFLCEQGADLPAHSVQLRADVDGEPASNTLATAELDAALCNPPDFEPYCVSLGGVEVEQGETYWLVLAFAGTFTETVFCEWATTDEDVYPFGYAAVGGPAGWNPVDEVISDPEHAYDFAFRICDAD